MVFVGFFRNSFLCYRFAASWKGWRDVAEGSSQSGLMAPPACGSYPGVPRAEPGFALAVSAGLGGNWPPPTCLFY